jgi:hypothetical protein
MDFIRVNQPLMYSSPFQYSASLHSYFKYMCLKKIIYVRNKMHLFNVSETILENFTKDVEKFYLRETSDLIQF